MNKPVWNKGDRVTWHQETTRSSVSTLPGIVKSASIADVTIEVLYRLGDQWVKESRNVTPESLVRRTRYVSGLDERQ